MASFARQLTLLRESKGLKKKELATILNVSAPCISQYESGIIMPSHDTLSRIAQFFGVSVDFLIADENDTPMVHLGEIFVDGKTYLDILTACREIPHKHREALMTVIYALQESDDS